MKSALWFVAGAIAAWAVSFGAGLRSVQVEPPPADLTGGAPPGGPGSEGFERGIVMLRYDGMPVPELPEAEHPVARVVPLRAIAEALPAGEPRIEPSERAAAIAERRRHVQRRFGY